MGKVFEGTSCLGIMSRHQRILQIYGLYIYFMFIGTDGQPPFTDGKSNLPSVPMDKVFEGTSCLGITLRHQRILKIYRWYIHLSIGTDGQPPFTDGQGFRGYLVPWYNVKAPKDITDLRIVYLFHVHRYGRTTSIYRR